MKQGKHQISKAKPPRRKKSSLTLLAALILLLTVAIGGTLAFLKSETSVSTNSFAVAGAPTPQIDEQFDGETKSNVKVTLSSEGRGAYYVRAAIVFSFQDDEGNTVAKLPAAGTDYTIELGSDWAWTPDYYYYSGTVSPGGSTTNLINTCTTLNTEYKLVVDIVAQIIQANPATAAQTEWGYTPAAA